MPRLSSSGPPLPTDQVEHSCQMHVRVHGDLRAYVQHWQVLRCNRTMNVYSSVVVEAASGKALAQQGCRTQESARNALSGLVMDLRGHIRRERPKRRRGGTDWLRSVLQRLALGALDLDNPQLTAEEEQGLAILMAAQVRRGSKVLKQRQESTKRAGGP